MGGKSFELVGRISPLEHTDTTFALFQPTTNTRDAQIESRTGISASATKITSLRELLDLGEDIEIIGIDEFHMFAPGDVYVIRELMKRGVKFIISALDLDYRGEMFPSICELLRLSPTELVYKKAACTRCRHFTAGHTQMLLGDQPVTTGLSQVLVDDGSYVYAPRCLACFVWPDR